MSHQVEGEKPKRLHRIRSLISGNRPKEAQQENQGGQVPVQRVKEVDKPAILSQRLSMDNSTTSNADVTPKRETPVTSAPKRNSITLSELWKVGTAPPSNEDVFVGYVTLSLKDCLLHRQTTYTLPLNTRRPEHRGAKLTVSTGPFLDDDVEVPVFPDLKTATAALLGQEFDFCIHVGSAEGIPQAYTGGIICRYAFIGKEGKPKSTVDAPGTTRPEWNFTKRFKYPAVDDELCKLFCGEALIFEVIGFPSNSAA